MAANSPQVNTLGRTRSPSIDSSHRPPGLPCAAEIHEFSVIGPVTGGEAAASAMLRNVVMRTLPGLTGRNSHRLGMCAAVFRTVAARSAVRLRQDGSCAQYAEYRSIPWSISVPLNRKCPGGLTPIIAERSTSFGYR